MQIVEKSPLGLRCARITLTSKGKPSFTLFPVIHIADRGFFEQVRDDSAGHDLVLYEGVRPPRWLPLRRIYRFFAQGCPGLVYQGDHLGSHHYGRAVRADMDADAFDRGFRSVPAWYRTLYFVTLALVLVLGRYADPRAILVRWMSSKHDRDRRDPIPDSGAPGKLDELIVRQRDKVLIAHCDAAIVEGTAARIAVIYGAGHMPALIWHLRLNQGYHGSTAEWMTAIAMTAPADAQRKGTPPRSAGSTERA